MGYLKTTSFQQKKPSRREFLPVQKLTDYYPLQERFFSRGVQFFANVTQRLQNVSQQRSYCGFPWSSFFRFAERNMTRGLKKKLPGGNAYHDDHMRLESSFVFLPVLVCSNGGKQRFFWKYDLSDRVATVCHFPIR